MGATIKDKTLEVRCDNWNPGHLPHLGGLVLRPGEDRYAALRRLGWDGSAPVVSAIMKVDTRVKKVTATEFCTAGNLFVVDSKLEGLGGYTLDRARHPELVGVKLRFTVKGEGLKWAGCQAGYNTVPWYSLAKLGAEVTFTTKEGHELNRNGLEERGLNLELWLDNMMIRPTLQHGPDISSMKFSVCALYNQGLPAWVDFQAHPELVPGMVLKPVGQDHRHRPVTWIPVEKEDWQMGVGRCSLLEVEDEAVDPNDLPSRAEFGRALTGLLRGMVKVAHARDRQDLETRLKESEPRRANSKVDFVWPQDNVVHNLSGRSKPPGTIVVDPACCSVGCESDERSRRVVTRQR